MTSDDVQLTEEELSKVNEIISGIQSDILKAIDKLKEKDYDGALKYIRDGITKSNCPLCKRELGILIADIDHNKQVCILKSDTCEEEQKLLIEKAKELKEDFVPIIQKKKAVKDKRKQLEKDYEEMNAIARKERAESNRRFELKNKAFPPLPHELLLEVLNNKK